MWYSLNLTTVGMLLFGWGYMFAKVPYVRYFFGKMYFCGKVWNTIERVVHLSGMVGVILLKVPYAR